MHRNKRRALAQGRGVEGLAQSRIVTTRDAGRHGRSGGRRRSSLTGRHPYRTRAAIALGLLIVVLLAFVTAFVAGHSG